MYLRPTSFQQCKKKAATHPNDPIDNEMYNDDKELTKGPVGPSSGSMTVRTRVIEGDSTEEAFDGGGIGSIETESEDEDPAATRRYWEARRKKGAHKVRVMHYNCLYRIADTQYPTVQLLSPRRKTRIHGTYNSAL